MTIHDTSLKDYLGYGSLIGSGGMGRVYNTPNKFMAAKIIPLVKTTLHGPITNVSCEYIRGDDLLTMWELGYAHEGKHKSLFIGIDKVYLGRIVGAFREIEVLMKSSENSYHCGGRLVGYRAHQVAIDEKGNLCMVVEMDKVVGRGLDSMLDDVGLSYAVKLLGDICEAVEQFHELGYCHLDVKPENVIIGENGPALIDYYTARPTKEVDKIYLEDVVMGDSAQHLEKDIFLGTLEYVAPEQARAKPTTNSDYYSVGLMAVEMLDKYPFERLRSNGWKTIENFLYGHQLKPSTASEVMARLQKSEVYGYMTRADQAHFESVVTSLLDISPEGRDINTLKRFVRYFESPVTKPKKKADAKRAILEDIEC